MSTQSPPGGTGSQQSDANLEHQHHQHAIRTPSPPQPHQHQHQHEHRHKYSRSSPKPHLVQTSDLASTTAPRHPNGGHHLATFSANRLGTAEITSDLREGPPTKRRKLSIRGKALSPHTLSTQRNPFQTTLDQFAFAQLQSPKPLNKLAVAQPHGQLLTTINGVHPTPTLREDAPPAPSSFAQSGLIVDNTSLASSQAEKPKPKFKPKPKSEDKDKRSLRSHDEGPRLKSELATYFPNYEEIIFETSKEVELFAIDTALYVTDDAPKQNKPDKASPSKVPKSGKSSPILTRRTSINGIPLPTTPQRTNAHQFNGSPILDLDFAAKTLPEKPEDPLSDEHFFKSHRRAERKEKQLRNIERERAMHEKVQLERLLDALQGYDWLRVLGITGITDSEAKKFEPKRDFFIAEVQALVDKFKQWKEQERKQRLDREAAAAAKEEEDEGSLEGSVGPPSSDLNASAARQLQLEALNAAKPSSAKPPSKGKDRLARLSPHAPSAHTASPTTQRPMPPPAPPSPEIPITSFYDRRHLRDAAVGKARHGRNVTAFGHAVPDMVEADFKLPSEYATEDALRANARERRRRKRDAVTNTTKSVA